MMRMPKRLGQTRAMIIEGLATAEWSQNNTYDREEEHRREGREAKQEKRRELISLAEDSRRK